MDEADGRKLWLDEAGVHAGNFLTRMLHHEQKRILSTSEEHFKHLAAAYIYLYEQAKNAGVLDEDDDYYIFEKETLH